MALHLCLISQGAYEVWKDVNNGDGINGQIKRIGGQVTYIHAVLSSIW